MVATLLGHLRERFPDTARLIFSGHSEAAMAARAATVAYRSLTKPCTGADLVATIERVCVLRDVFCTPQLRRVIGTIGELPSLSSTYTALARAIQDPNTSIGIVARIVEKDVAMTAKVLQLVNSSFFGLTQPITTLQNAVNYLGMGTMKNLALASDTFRVFQPNARIPRSFFENLQAHAHRTAVIAGALPLEPRMRDVGVVSALLHDIGGLVLASRLPEQVFAVAALMKERRVGRCEAEEEILGTSHAEIGAYLLGLWGINTVTVEAVAHHHHPLRIAHASLDTSTAVYVADLLEHELEVHREDTACPAVAEADRNCLETLGVLEELPRYRELARVALHQA